MASAPRHAQQQQPLQQLGMLLDDYSVHGAGDQASLTETAHAPFAEFAFGYRSDVIGKSRVIHADCFEWLGTIPENSLHAIITDPPYGVKEYDFDQMAKRANGAGGVWRIPPAFDGNVRAPLPRFTALLRHEFDSHPLISSRNTSMTCRTCPITPAHTPYSPGCAPAP